MEIRIVQIQDAEALLSIYAPYVEQTAITFEYDVPTVDEFRRRKPMSANAILGLSLKITDASWAMPTPVLSRNGLPISGPLRPPSMWTGMSVARESADCFTSLWKKPYGSEASSI